jgi:hypothetical protein
LPIGFTLIHRTDDRTAHFKLCHLCFSAGTPIRLAHFR